MRKAIPLLALGLMVVGLIFTAFGTQILPAAQALLAPSNACPSPCYPATGIVYYMTPQAKPQPDLGLNYVGAGMSLLGAIVFGATYPTRHLNSVRLYLTTPHQVKLLET